MHLGSAGGSIRVWRLVTLEEERVLLSDGDGRVFALTVLEGQVISRHRSGRVRAWDAGAGEGRRGLDGHTRDVASLCGLASGSSNTSIDGQGDRA